MANLILSTFDGVPEAPRGYVRDLRVRWALEEAGLPYEVRAVSFRDRNAEHFAHQPFGQVPWITDGDAGLSGPGIVDLRYLYFVYCEFRLFRIKSDASLLGARHGSHHSTQGISSS